MIAPGTDSVRSCIGFQPRWPLHFYEAAPRRGDEPRPSDPLPDLTSSVDLQVQLSPRRQQVAVLIARGYSTKEIAAHLGTSVRTVDCLRDWVYKLTGCHRIALLTQYAIARGWIHNEFLK